MNIHQFRLCDFIFINLHTIIKLQIQLISITTTGEFVLVTQTTVIEVSSNLTPFITQKAI